jgi:hypothetical protein
LLFSKLASAGYIEKTDGFYLKHFAKSPDLKNESCYQFNGRIYRGGQPDLTSRSANNGGLTSQSLQYPIGIYVDGTRVFIADESNFRILIAPIPGI